MANLAQDRIDNLRCQAKNEQTGPASANEIESDDASSQFLRPNENNTGHIEGHEEATEVSNEEDEETLINSKENDSVIAGGAEGEATTANSQENGSVITTPAIQTVKVDNSDVSPSPPAMLKEPDHRRPSQKQLTVEGKGLYAGLGMVECKCIKVDNSLDSPIRDPLDFTRFLERIPHCKLALLQINQMRPQDTVREWFITVQTGGHKKRSTSQSVEDLPTQVPGPEACLHGFTVALEERAKAEDWPEHEELAALTIAEIGEEGRKKVIDGKNILAIGRILVDKLMRDVETAKLNAKAKQEAQVNEEEETSQPHEKDCGCPRCKAPPPTPSLVDNRRLQDRNLYKKVGSDYYLRSGNTWILSLNPGQYKALLEIHRTLLHEHYDFFSVSQHPSASPALQKSAKTYSMPARMWRHGIHAFLEVLRHRLPESREFMSTSIPMVYNLLALLDDTVPQFRRTWVECKGDLARYCWACHDEGMQVGERWKNVCQEEYTRALYDDPTVGRLYHHLGILMKPAPESQSDIHFDATVLQLFYFTKSLVVETPCFTSRDSLFVVIDRIISQDKARKPASIPSTDKDHFLAAVTNLILASLETNILQAHGYKTGKEEYLQAVYEALKKIGRTASAEQVWRSSICPSAEIGLLLCQLLLGIPSASGRWSSMMAAWAPDLVTPADRANLATNMANAKDVHNATIAIIHTMVPYLLAEADTRDLRVWGFIYVILVFIRSLRTRPGLREWLRGAFHVEILAPFLNMLLREDETRGRRALENASQLELLMLCSPLNQKDKPGKYGLSTIDNIREYYPAHEEYRKAEGSVNTASAEVTLPEAVMVTTEEAKVNNSAHETNWDAEKVKKERMYTNPLPEDELLRGHFFAREAEVACLPAVEATIAAVQTAEGAAVDQAQEESLTDCETESKAQKEEQTERKNEDARQRNGQVEGDAQKTQEEEEQREAEAEEARETKLMRQERLLRDPPLFPAGWFKNSKYDFDERQARHHYVQDAGTCDNRSRQLLCLAVQLIGVFFELHTDENGRHWISVLGGPLLKSSTHIKMPEIVEREGGVKVVYVDPSYCVTNIEKETNKMAMEEEKRQIGEENSKVTMDMVTAVEETAKGDTDKRSTQSEALVHNTDAEETLEAIKLSTRGLGLLPKDEIHEPDSAHNLNLAKTLGLVKTTTAAKKPMSETMLSITHGDGSQDAAAVTAFAEDQTATTTAGEVFQLSTARLNSIPTAKKTTKAIKSWILESRENGADEDDWTHVSAESHGKDAETVQVAAGSVISRYVCSWRR